MKKMLMKLAVVVVTAGLAAGCCQECQDTQANEALVQRFVDAYNAKLDLSTLDEFFSADCVRHCQATEPTEMHGIEEFARFLAEDRAQFPDARMTVQQLVAQGDRVAFFARWVGTQQGPMGPYPASGKQAELDIAGIHRIEAGKIVETWVTWDNLTSLEQLGHFPPQPAEEPEQPEE